MAAFVIGCGGGGGGNGSKGGLVIGGSSGGSVATTGTVTTGGTTGAAVTTGSGAGEPTTDGGSIDPTTGGGVIDPTTGTSDPTTGTIDPTTGTSDPTTGSSDPTTGSVDPTTGSATTGSTEPTTGSTGPVDPTTGGSTTGGSTTGGSTTGSDTTGGSTTGGLPGASALRANAVYFGRFADPSVVSSVLPDGSGRLDEGGGGFDVTASIADPDQAGGFVYAASVGGRYGVYRGATFDPAASTTLAPPTFDSVTALQSSASGAVLVVGSSNGASTAFLLANGAVTPIDAADDAAFSLDGTQVAYSRSYGSDSDLYLWNRNDGASVRMNTGGDALLPSFSKDGAWILFSSIRDRDGGSYDLYQIPTAGGTVERITNTPDIDELGGCYNEARTQISYVSYSGDPDKMGVFVLSNLGANRIAADGDLGLATYWTDANGRSRRLHRGGRFQRFPAKARARAKAARRRK